MLRLVIDWAADEAPELGMDEKNGVNVAAVDEVGPAGWPTYCVYAVDGPAMWSWLRTNYTNGDGDEASDLAGLADSF